MQCSVTKDKLSKMLTTNPQGIATFFKKLNQQEFSRPQKGNPSAAEQLEHLCLSYTRAVNLIRNKENVGSTSQATYRMYSDISKLYQKTLTINKKSLLKMSADSTNGTIKESLINTYLKETKTFRDLVQSYSEFELDHKTLNQIDLGQLSIREYIFFLLHQDKHHVISLQAALR